MLFLRLILLLIMGLILGYHQPLVGKRKKCSNILETSYGKHFKGGVHGCFLGLGMRFC